MGRRSVAETKEIQNQLKYNELVYGKIVNPYDQKELMRFTESLVDNLDDTALNDLFEGSQEDVDALFLEIIQETLSVVNMEHKSISSPFQHIDSITNNIDEFLRSESFPYFIQSVLKDFLINWHHLEWMNYIQLYQNLCLVASRSLGKSFFMSWALPLWKMYRYKKSTPLQKQSYDIKLCQEGMLFTYEMSLAEELLLKIKEEIEANDILRPKLYNPKGDNWSKRSITCLNGATFKVKSYGSAARGRHPGYVIVDDFLVENVLFSKDFNDRIINYFHSVIANLPLKGGGMYVVGTPFTAQDLYSDLKKKKTFKVFEYPAVMPNGDVTWEDFYPMSKILEKRATQGSLVFSREILCTPITTDSTIFPYHILERCFSPSFSLVNNIHSAPTKFQRIVMGCDFAISGNVGADYSVFTTVGVDEKDCYWILNIHRSKGKSYQEQIAIIKTLYSNFRHDLIYMEDNQMQAIFVQEAKSSSLPVRGYRTTASKHSLTNGWPSLAVLFENQRFRIPRGDMPSQDLTDLLVTECTSITYASSGGLKTTGAHDDLVSSLYIAIQAAQDQSYSGNLKLHLL